MRLPVLVIAPLDDWRRALERELRDRELTHFVADNGTQGAAIAQQVLPPVVVLRLVADAGIDNARLAELRGIHPLVRSIVITDNPALTHLLELVEGGVTDVFRAGDSCATIVDAIAIAHDNMRRWLQPRCEQPSLAAS